MISCDKTIIQIVHFFCWMTVQVYNDRLRDLLSTSATARSDYEGLALRMGFLRPQQLDSHAMLRFSETKLSKDTQTGSSQVRFWWRWARWAVKDVRESLELLWI